MGFVLRRKNGSRFDAVLSAKTITINGSAHLVCVVRTITGRKSSSRSGRVGGQELAAAESRKPGPHGRGHRPPFQQPVAGGAGQSGNGGDAAQGEGSRPASRPGHSGRRAGRGSEQADAGLPGTGLGGPGTAPCFPVLCRASLSSLRTTSPPGSRWIWICPAPGPVISANAAQIQQALANL